MHIEIYENIAKIFIIKHEVLCSSFKFIFHLVINQNKQQHFLLC